MGMLKKANGFFLIPVNLLSWAAFEPDFRVTDDTTKELKGSIAKEGQLQPLTVVPDGNGKYIIGDGHRRYYVLVKLGRSHAVCHVVTDMPVEDVFRISNTGSRSLSGMDAQAVWLKEPEAVSTGTNKGLTAAWNRIGKEAFMDVHNNGLTVKNLLEDVRVVNRWVVESKSRDAQKIRMMTDVDILYVIMDMGRDTVLALRRNKELSDRVRGTKIIASIIRTLKGR